jgi:glucosylceramidase
VKFIEAYSNYGIDFWGLTVQNEPMAIVPWESCYYNSTEERAFLVGFLGPLIRKQFPQMKIMIYDHNKDLVFNWSEVILSDAAAASYVDGVAFHCENLARLCVLLIRRNHRVQRTTV